MNKTNRNSSMKQSTKACHKDNQTSNIVEDTVSDQRSSFSYLDFQTHQSNIYSCESNSDSDLNAGLSRLSSIRLLSAKEAGEILGVNPNAVYMLWKKNLLDFWCIHGTKKTNLDAIASFLERTRNQELQLDA